MKAASLICPLFCVGVLLMGFDLPAQRTSFVFHVYVDPIFGDNGSAWEMNPGNPTVAALANFCRFPGQLRPLPLSDRDTINPFNAPPLPTNSNYAHSGNLQHAPYPFRTLTRDDGALAYVNAVLDDLNTPGQTGPVLPWASGNLQISHVVIHCLPGLYGPRRDNLADDEVDIDPVSGLPWNGEEFPVELGQGPGANGPLELWDRVSIQGTSALDTIFDGRSNDPAPDLSPNTRTSNIFRVWTGNGDEQQEAFIDGVTIRNAGSLPGSGNGMHGIGIHMVGLGVHRLRVTNCFFINNVAGIVIDAFGTGQDRGIHRPVIANNTFVDNLVGIWSGELTTGNPAPNEPYIQAHAPLVINNILLANQNVASSAFEGLAPAVLLVSNVDGSPIPPQDFNGWVPGDSNFGFVPAAPNWAGAAIGFQVFPILPPPGVDLTNVANLFVRDLLAGAGISDDAHDYRLSPFVSDNAAVSPGAMMPLMPNPLIGAGVNRAQPNGPTPGITNIAGNGFSFAPGLPAGSEEAPIHGWDWDCEGFGNSRLLPRTGILPNPLPQFGTIDIGADQCGGLIMAGYIPSTRLVACQSPNAGLTGYDRLFYVEEPNAAGFPRPDSAWRLGMLPWYENVQMAPIQELSPCATPAPFTYYTEGARDIPNGLLSPRFQCYALGNFGPSPRHLGCDFGPSLLVDLHGYWDQWMSQYRDLTAPGFMPDPYATNPVYYSWWQEVDALGVAVGPTGSAFYPDNNALFHNRGYANPHGPIATWLPFRDQETWVGDAHLNPPATLFLAGFNTQFILPSGVFGPFGACPPQFATSTWGLNDACPDTLPPLGLELGLRVNCEIPLSRSLTAANTNLQTFLLLANCGAGGATAQMASSPRQPEPALPLGLQIEAARLLNLPPELGTESEFRAYSRAMREFTR